MGPSAMRRSLMQGTYRASMASLSRRLRQQLALRVLQMLLATLTAWKWTETDVGDALCLHSTRLPCAGMC